MAARRSASAVPFRDRSISDTDDQKTTWQVCNAGPFFSFWKNLDVLPEYA